jgi:hypothetical protein
MAQSLSPRFAFRHGGARPHGTRTCRSRQRLWRFTTEPGSQHHSSDTHRSPWDPFHLCRTFLKGRAPLALLAPSCSVTFDVTFDDPQHSGEAASPCSSAHERL